MIMISTLLAFSFSFQNVIYLLPITGDKYPVWIVSDMRRRSDLAWFREHYPGAVYTVRITATEEARKKRGWVFTAGELLRLPLHGLVVW